MEPVKLILTHREVSGPVGKLISRVGADAQVAHADAGDALDHLDIAAQIDERGDAELEQALVACHRAVRADSVSERTAWLHTAIGHMQRAREIDELEEDQWRVFATERVVTAREACIRIVERTESALTRRKAAA